MGLSEQNITNLKVIFLKLIKEKIPLTTPLMLRTSGNVAS